MSYLCNDSFRKAVGRAACALRRIGVRNEGTSLIEIALVLPLFIILVVASVDFGRAYYQAIEVDAAAHAGAMYGLQNPQDAAGMKSAAIAGVSNVGDLQASAAYGCECSDGTFPTASCTSIPACTNNYVTYVDVTTTSTFRPLFSYPGLPRTFTLKGETKMRVGGN